MKLPRPQRFRMRQGEVGTAINRVGLFNRDTHNKLKPPRDKEKGEFAISRNTRNGGVLNSVPILCFSLVLINSQSFVCLVHFISQNTLTHMDQTNANTDDLEPAFKAVSLLEIFWYPT